MTNIALLPAISGAATTSQDGDCILAIGFQNSGSPIDLTGITFSMTWRLVNAFGAVDQTQILLSASTAGSYLSNGGVTGVVTLNVPASKLALMPAATYQADLVAVVGGETLVVGTITFTHSVSGPCLWTSLTTTVRNAATANSIGYVPGPGWNQYKGNWSSTANYVQNDVVFSGVSSWIALQASTNQTPAVGANWNLVAPGVDPTAMNAATASASASASTATTQAGIATSQASNAAGSASGASASASGAAASATTASTAATNSAASATAAATSATNAGASATAAATSATNASTSATAAATSASNASAALAGAVRVDISQSFTAAQIEQALVNLTQAPLTFTTNTALNGTYVGRRLRFGSSASAAATLTLPSGVGDGFTTGALKNETTKYALTVGVPSGAVLDGTTNGTVTILPFQKASFYFDADGWHTYWEDYSPVVLSRKVSSVSSVDWNIPQGYSTFEIVMSALSASTSTGVVGWASNDGGATFRNGASDYFQFLVSGSGSAVSVSGAALSGILLAPNMSTSSSEQGAIAKAIMEAVYGSTIVESAGTAGSDVVGVRRSYQSTAGGKAIISPINFMRIVPSSGTFTANISMRALP